MAEGNDETGTAVISWELPRIRTVTERPTSLLDHVEVIMNKLWEDDEFFKLVNTITNKNSVTGKFEVDRGFAAKKIQDLGSEMGFMDVAAAKLSRIMNAIETLLRREKKGRKQRLETLRLIEAQQTEVAVAAE